ncbi:glutathione S-transferase [Mycena leptocephala]|nr:glutathione S-transferase [Mycena leptocephala]
MTILKLYGGKIALCMLRVATVLHELQVSFELVEIPYIDDDGLILYETHAIFRYVATNHPASEPIPTKPKANALFEQAAAVEFTTFGPSTSVNAVEQFKRCVVPGYFDQALVDKKLEILNTNLDAYEVILSKQRYVAGDENIVWPTTDSVLVKRCAPAVASRAGFEKA